MLWCDLWRTKTRVRHKISELSRCQATFWSLAPADCHGQLLEQKPSLTCWPFEADQCETFLRAGWREGPLGSSFKYWVTITAPLLKTRRIKTVAHCFLWRKLSGRTILKSLLMKGEVDFIFCYFAHTFFVTKLLILIAVTANQSKLLQNYEHDNILFHIFWSIFLWP